MVRGAGSDAPSRTDVSYDEITARIMAIDYDSRELTLEYEDGSTETLTASPAVKRFDEAEVGDLVEVEYVTALGMELRAPTAEELAEPYVELEGNATAPESEAPAGAIGRMIRAVCTVEVLDRIHNTATLMGPNGNLLTIRAKDPANLTKVRIGDTVVTTYTEAVVMSLAKVEKE
jgi:hypothetical protein